MTPIIKILPVQNIRKMKNNTPNYSGKLTFKKDVDRRKRARDRRNSVRNGVHVRLTFKADRRRGIDRREKHGRRSAYQALSIHTSSDK